MRLTHQIFRVFFASALLLPVLSATAPLVAAEQKAALAAASGKDGPLVWRQEVITADTIWKGEVHVPQKVTVAAGVTLTIEPGTTVLVARERGLWVNGKLRAVGMAERPIRFSIIGGSVDDGHWHQLMFENGEGVFEHCLFEYASVGLHSHFSRITVRRCEFKANETGMMFKGGPVVITDSVFSDNGFGVVLNLAQGSMEQSLITGNEVGIMVRAEQNSGMRIRGSNIYGNSRYNLKMGDFNNNENIDVRENWWGTANPAETMFDDRFEPGIGHAIFEPAATGFISEK